MSYYTERDNELDMSDEAARLVDQLEIESNKEMTNKNTKTATKVKRKKQVRGEKQKVNCACCGNEFIARVADVKRGWGKFCSKSCKAKRQKCKNAK